MVVLTMLCGEALAVSGDLVMTRLEETKGFRAHARLKERTPTISEEMYRKGATGEVQTDLMAVDGHKAKVGYGVAVVDVAIGRFYAAVNDDPSKPNHTKLDYTEVLKGGVCGENRTVFMNLPAPFPLTDRYWIVNARQNNALLEASGGKVRQMTWESQDPPMVPAGTKAAEKAADGMPIEFAKGAWYLTEIDAGHTLVEYWTWTDPGGNIPAGLASSFAAGGIKDTFVTMTQLAKKGARCQVR